MGQLERLEGIAPLLRILKIPWYGCMWHNYLQIDLPVFSTVFSMHLKMIRVKNSSFPGLSFSTLMRKLDDFLYIVEWQKKPTKIECKQVTSELFGAQHWCDPRKRQWLPWWILNFKAWSSRRSYKNTKRWFFGCFQSDLSSSSLRKDIFWQWENDYKHLFGVP